MPKSVVKPLGPLYNAKPQAQLDDGSSAFGKFPSHAQFIMPFSSQFGSSAQQTEQGRYIPNSVRPAINRAPQFKIPTTSFPDIPVKPGSGVPATPLSSRNAQFRIPTTPFPDVPVTPLPLVSNNRAQFRIPTTPFPDIPTTPVPSVRSIPAANRPSAIIDNRTHSYPELHTEWLPLPGNIAVLPQKTGWIRVEFRRSRKVSQRPSQEVLREYGPKKPFKAPLFVKLILGLLCLCSVIYLIYYLIYIDKENLSFSNILFITLFSLFLRSGLVYLRDRIRSGRYFKSIGKFELSIDELIAYAVKIRKPLPRIAIFVPARNEGYVIENTVRRLVKLDYIKSLYRIFVITDERELDDNVEILTKNVVQQVAEQVNTVSDQSCSVYRSSEVV